MYYLMCCVPSGYYGHIVVLDVIGNTLPHTSDDICSPDNLFALLRFYAKALSGDYDDGGIGLQCRLIALASSENAFGVTVTILPSYHSQHINNDNFKFPTPGSTKPDKWDKISKFFSISHMHFDYQSYMPDTGFFLWQKQGPKSICGKGKRGGKKIGVSCLRLSETPTTPDRGWE